MLSTDGKGMTSDTRQIFGKHIHAFSFGMAFLLVSCGLTAQVASRDAELTRSIRDVITTAQRGDEQHALNLVAIVVKKHPEYAPALKLQGMLLEDLGHEQEAAASYKEALTLRPNDTDLLLKVAIAELVGGHAAEASALLQRRLRTAPHDEEGLYYLAQALHLQGKDGVALTTIQEAARFYPNSAQVIQKYGELLCSIGDSEGGTRQLLRAQQLDPKLDRLDFDLAVASYNGMDWQKAITYAQRRAQAQPADISNLTLLASAEMKLGQWSDAETLLRVVTDARKDDAASMLQLGHCELELKNYSAAIANLQQALELDPTQVLAHFLLSRAYANSGNKAEAQHQAALHREMLQHVSYTRSKAEATRDAELAEQARDLLTQKKEKIAFNLFQAAPMDAAAAWVSVASVHLSMGDSEGAEQCVQRALDANPKIRNAYLYMGIVALQQGDLSRAEAMFKTELEIDPNHFLAQGELGEVRYRQARWTEAAELIEKSKTTVPSLLYMLCDSYFHMGKPQSADLIAESLCAYGRNQAELLHALKDLLVRNGQSELADRLITRQPT